MHPIKDRMITLENTVEKFLFIASRSSKSPLLYLKQVFNLADAHPNA